MRVFVVAVSHAQLCISLSMIPSHQKGITSPGCIVGYTVDAQVFSGQKYIGCSN